MKRLALLLALAGCDQVFGLDRDASIDTPSVCTPLPDFSTWTFGPVTVNTPGILDGFTARPTDFIYASGGKLYEAQALTDIGTPLTYFLDQPNIDTPELSSDGLALTYEDIQGGSVSHVWFAQRSSVAVWTAKQELLLDIAVGRNRPGPIVRVGADDYRMVVAFDGTLVELHSADRVTWTAMTTIGFSNHEAGGPDDIDPYLTADGCWLLFGSNRTGGNYSIYATSRPDPAKPFVLPQQIPGLTLAMGHNASEPSMPGGTALWFLDDPGSSNWQLVRGVPP